MPRVVITSPFMKQGDDGHRRLLEAGFDTIFAYPEKKGDEEELIRALQGADGVVAGNDPFTSRVLGACSHLKVLARTGVGYDAVDVEAATRRGIVVTINPGVNRHAVAEHTFALILACSRRLGENLAEIRRGGWYRYDGADLAGSTLGIIGLGTIGKEVAQRARAFEMRILAFGSVQDRQFAEEHGVSFVSLEMLLRESDFVTLHTRLTPQSHHMIDAGRLALMKPTAYLINTARGGLVDTQALCHVLREKLIAGAALDVFEREPLEAESPLRALDNVYLSPHTAGSSLDATRGASVEAAENVIRVLRGEGPIYAVNPEALRP